MSVFDYYAHYYNLLYRDKDYAAEAKYVDRLIKQHSPAATRLLNLGCGTGKHDFVLAAMGYQITGVDMAANMITQAQTAAKTRNFEHVPQFLQGDIRTLRIDKKFDVIVSLFHVVSYQITNQDIVATFTTVRHHLNPGGIFIFDVWYGPGVLTNPPTVRIKRLEDESIRVVRIAEPVMRPSENVVDVNYSLFIQNKQDDTRTELIETHKMRYLFVPEIELMLNQCNVQLLHVEEWLTGNAPEFAWNVCFVCQC